MQALGIDALHTMGIIHRDIKPENILLDAHTNNVRITDFNAAFLHPGDAPLENGAVYTKEYAGSKPYLAPEIIRRRWYGKMVDWWSLGCMMFDLVSGEVSRRVVPCASLSRTNHCWTAPIPRRDPADEVRKVGRQERGGNLLALGDRPLA